MLSRIIKFCKQKLTQPLFIQLLACGFEIGPVKKKKINFKGLFNTFYLFKAIFLIKNNSKLGECLRKKNKFQIDFLVEERSVKMTIWKFDNNISKNEFTNLGFKA